MATAAAPDTVWVGFMDVVPVIGTVKEGVEWILAVYENNPEVLMEKEKQIIRSLQMMSEMDKLEEGMEKLSLPTTSEATQEKGLGTAETSGVSALEFAGLQNIREIKENMTIEYVRSCLGRKHGKVEMSKKEMKEMKEVKQKIEKIKKDVQDKLLLLRPDGRLARELMIEVRRSKRGEHVFNNGVLKFHSKVLRRFKDQYGIQSKPSYRNLSLTELDQPTLSPTIKAEIVKEMMVYFEDTEFYVNANAVLYGRFSQELGNALHEVLECVYPDRVSEEKREEVNRIINLMNKHEIYVDHLAKEKWTDGGKRGMERFRRVKDEVVRMYCEQRGYGWCIRVLERLRSWFETPH